MTDKTYAILLAPGEKPAVIEFDKKEKGLEFYYKNLDCSCIDIVHCYGIWKGMNADGKDQNAYSLVVDDEGLLKADPQINMAASLLYGFFVHGEPIVGRAMVCKDEHTDEGIETVGLTLDEIEEVYGFVGQLARKAGIF